MTSRLTRESVAGSTQDTTISEEILNQWIR